MMLCLQGVTWLTGPKAGTWTAEAGERIRKPKTTPYFSASFVLRLSQSKTALVSGRRKRPADSERSSQPLPVFPRASVMTAESEGLSSSVVDVALASR